MLCCPRCGSYMEKAIAFNGGESEFWWECVSCNTFVNSYTPQSHQAAVHKDGHRYIGNFGGYGTGKTLTSREEVIKHCLLTDNANVLIGANVASQYEQTIKRELEADIPKAFVRDYNTQKSYMDLINGARIMYRPFDDPDKLRSYNLTMFVIVEASEVKAESFTQLRTRLRNRNATVPKLDKHGNPVYVKDERGHDVPVLQADWRRGIIESNPGAGWIRENILHCASDIQKHGEVIDNYSIPDSQKDPSIGVHVASTDVNKYLPPTFIAELVKNRPMWWIKRFIYSSFSYAEGLVYPSAANCVVTPYEIPNHWLRMAAFDYGLSDDAVFLWLAIDQEREKVVVYKEVRAKDRDIEALAKLFKANSADIPVGGWLCPPLIDPKSGTKRDYNKRTLIDLMSEQGVFFKPGHVNRDARVLRLNTYIENGKLEIFNTCEGLVKEIKNLKFKEIVGADGMRSNKPDDKDDHGVCALEWATMELPATPANLIRGAFDKFGRDTTQLVADQRKHLPFALQDEPQAGRQYNLADAAYGIAPIAYDF